MKPSVLFLFFSHILLLFFASLVLCFELFFTPIFASHIDHLRVCVYVNDPL
jgi:hypothetical protein